MSEISVVGPRDADWRKASECKHQILQHLLWTSLVIKHHIPILEDPHHWVYSLVHYACSRFDEKSFDGRMVT